MAPRSFQFSAREVSMKAIGKWFERRFGAAVLTMAFTLSGAWLWAAVWLISRSSRCSVPPSGADWLSTFVLCRDPNEIGDTLAGVFAPLAFILLGAAVVIQSRELRAQQHEMAESRKVFKEQRDLMEAQILESKRSADLFSAQNEILRAQEEARLHALEVSKLQQMLSQFALVIRAKLYKSKPLYHVGTAEQLDLFQNINGDLSEDDLTAIGTAARSALMVHEVRASSFEAGWLEELRVKDDYGFRDVFLATIELASRIVALSHRLGAEQADLVAELQIADLAELMQTFLEHGQVEKTTVLAAS
ncbi:hypothetical protein U8C37_03190 [Sinorhizobium medicae]|uniref:hypothetical protein n=1 Tax=Sinorhizobium medicae TaxID=110321 RepID=UPI002AF6C36D|nr:hypothetical protein [Sinorhizobium medicae]WQO86409.1 hypothetical protein U8C37_03190 [Sinorhizobium medicae]